MESKPKDIDKNRKNEIRELLNSKPKFNIETVEDKKGLQMP